jgi:3-deoxy-7-phosphoheptulonate synthase
MTTLISPRELKARYPLAAAQAAQVMAARRAIRDIIHGQDPDRT